MVFSYLASREECTEEQGEGSHRKGQDHPLFGRCFSELHLSILSPFPTKKDVERKEAI